MRQAPSPLLIGRKSTPRWDGSTLSRHWIIRWGLLIALPLVGMLLLRECFLLRGVFAVLGPLMILVAAKLIASRVKKILAESIGEL